MNPLPNMRLTRLCGLLLALMPLMLLAACGTQSSADELATELQTVTSWAATAHMVGDTWVKDDVPTAYATQTLEAAREAIGEERDALARASTAPAEPRTALMEQVETLEQTLEQMSTAIEREDRAAVAEQLKRLTAAEQAIATLVKSAGEQ